MPHDTEHHWRSLNELADSPEFRRFVEAEFPDEADRGGVSRRRWLQLMGASIALGSAASCRWEKTEILPFAKRPADRVPGASKQFATGMEISGVATGLMATSHDGRPTKLEGNPRHPASLGATHPQAQAAVLTLYDPDRSRTIVQQADGQPLNQPWEKLVDAAKPLFAEARKNNGAGLRVLSRATSSPTLLAMRDRLLEEFPDARWVEWEPVSRDNEREGIRQALGRPLRPQWHLDRAKVIVALDEDFLGGHPNSVRHARDFISRRVPPGAPAGSPSSADPHPGPHPEGSETAGWINRLYAIESRYTITGAAADHRLPIRSGDIRRLVDEIERDGRRSTIVPAAVLRAIVDDLQRHRGECLVVAGANQPPEVHAAVVRINAALGNIGQTITFTEEPGGDRPPYVAALRGLVDEMAGGDVNTLLILGGNPVYDAPADVDFAAALRKVGASIHLGLYRDETARRCTWHVPEAHFLESWGDARAWDGTYTPIQPLIRPLYGGRTAIEMLGLVMAVRNLSPKEKVLARFRRLFEPDADGGVKAWRAALHAGMVEGSAFTAVEPELTDATSLATGGENNTDAGRAGDQSVELVLYPDAKLLDGRFANNAWLQELPDPMLRSCWTNAAVMSPATAERLGVVDNQVVAIEAHGATLQLPAYIMPGQADGSIAVALGYGRAAAGAVGGDVESDVEPVGQSAYAWRRTDTMDVIPNAEVTPTRYRSPVPCVQDHFAIDSVGRKRTEQQAEILIREATLEHYRHHPDFAEHKVHHPPPAPLWEPWEYPDNKWGMAIDLTRCIGCGACVVACQAENNIPVVGPEQVLDGREMLWLRVDRYFKGEPESPQASMQPVACHHCETAPCEQVCPVNATVHSHEGLNDMVYNRCVGTRYCSNNCPFKVRRFNYFNYHTDLDDPANESAKMKYNPEVTVRSRGVMEKCTYCVQRIQAAKIRAKNERRPVADGEIQTACQQACPTGAIVFGNLNESGSEVARRHADARAYTLLGGLNLEVRTAYLARIRNPNPKI